MNSIIKTQLEKCRVANIPEFDEDSTTITIPQGSNVSVSPYQVHRCYLIELADYILNPPPDFTLAINWNKGQIPQYKYFKCEILQIMGKMVKFNGVGYDPIKKLDTTYVWEGWVPQKGIKLLQELN